MNLKTILIAIVSSASETCTLTTTKRDVNMGEKNRKEHIRTNYGKLSAESKKK